MTAPSRTLRLIDDRYEVLGTLGEGGMAVVLAARDRRLSRDVAIKVLRPHLANDPRIRERFGREAHAAASLNHPNIIEIYDVGLHDQTPYIAMQLVRGQTLKQVISSDAPFHPDDVTTLMRQIGNALDHAHAHGYVHRDVKPGNILIDVTGHAFVADFGIAKGIEDPDLTDFGGGFGTASYMAPEQVLGQMATPATDVYAAGVIAFELLTGKLPFAAGSPVAMAMRHVHEEPPPPSLVNPLVPSVHDAIVLKALDKNPTRRWPSMHDFVHALATWQHNLGSDGLPLERRSPATRKSGSRLTALAAITVVLLAGGLIWFGLHIGNDRLDQEPSTAPPVSVIETSIEPTEDPLPTDQPTAAPRPTVMPAPALAPAPTIAPVSAQGFVAPDVRGISISDAMQTLLQHGLRIALNGSEYSSSTPMNAIISQDPAPGVALDPGTVVRVTLSRGPSPFNANDNP